MVDVLTGVAAVEADAGSRRRPFQVAMEAQTRRRLRWLSTAMLTAVGVLLAVASGCSGIPSEPASAEPLKIGLLLDYTGSPQASEDRQRAFDLAILHINEGGGVLGMPVESVAADATPDPSTAVEVARRLVEVDGVHAIVGPNASAASLPISQQVSGPLNVPTISPSASSPELTGAADDDYFFRTAPSDIVQGPLLAAVTSDRGFDNVALVYQDDTYGRGLAGAFEASWEGPLQLVSVGMVQTSYLAELQQIASEGAQALVIVTGEGHALPIVREALAEGLFDQFVFADAAKRASLVTELGGDTLGDMHGTGGAASPDNAATAQWEAAFIAEYGALPVLAYVKETYDATVAVALAAQAAASTEGAAVRDRLRAIAGPPGETVTATPAGVADALSKLAEGAEVDFDGASSTLDWDDNGDLSRGHLGIWRFTHDERIEELATVPYNATP